MPITHTNAKDKTYYLHQGMTKTGKPKLPVCIFLKMNLCVVLTSSRTATWLFSSWVLMGNPRQLAKVLGKQ
jgi:hypothetical protein